LQGKVDAADLVQDTFLEAHRHFAQFRGTGEAELVCLLRQILAGLLANLVRQYCGTQRRDLRLERELADELDQSSRTLDRSLAAPHSTPSERAMRREHAVLLANALERLPDDYREVIILRHLEGRSFAEVSQRMGRSVDSVKNLWARAWRSCAVQWEAPMTATDRAINNSAASSVDPRVVRALEVRWTPIVGRRLTLFKM
jgi:RNA polymerase sigma-70 factor (ECF subfamily)